MYSTTIIPTPVVPAERDVASRLSLSVLHRLAHSAASTTAKGTLSARGEGDATIGDRGDYPGTRRCAA